ncbi:hypothetical protein GPECTOR_96g710 [Gonium pectorale]|uniref:Uncharacterized protein n=1 Tax=Gonium pectorale TaxID=33097 RepID=A0A150G076_GONPE|nr:hypothetical protein GPECTOR_96g710 [Gonium pectorale]|eukprot:KXZ43244.1 hypothetical protein GPECTOR_96g710 [Gonium pectorale]
MRAAGGAPGGDAAAAQQRSGTVWAASPVWPHLERMLCDRYGGSIVALGTVGDRPALVKLLRPGAAAIQAYHVEREAYDSLAELQGTMLPELPAAGRTFDDLNVFSIATALVLRETLWRVLDKR